MNRKTRINSPKKPRKKQMTKEAREQRLLKQRTAVATFTPSKYKDKSKYKANGELK